MTSKVDEIIASELQQLNVTRSTDVGTAQPDPSNNMRAEPDPHCIACGHHHGSVGAHIKCLERALIRAQNEAITLHNLRAEVADVRKRWPAHNQDGDK